MTEQVILFLCKEEELREVQRGYSWAFAKHARVIFWEPIMKDGCHGSTSVDLLLFLEQLSLKPMLILYPEASPCLPWGLAQVDIPTACFHIDTYGFMHHRIRWSMLFDYTFVFHPGFDKIFHQAGIPRAIMLAHAADATLFQELRDDERIYEVGWVGRLDSCLYARRRRVLALLAERFRMNDWLRRHSQEEMADVYRHSKIVVNVSVESYPQENNLRLFEAMSAGALLMTVVPTELTQLGFQEGEHFVGYRNAKEIVDLVSYYLTHEQERSNIAKAGREKVLLEHTYDQRVKNLLSIIEKDKGELFAPARRWPEVQVRQLYLDYYTSYLLLDDSVRQIGHLKRFGPLAILKALLPFLKAIVRALRMALT